MLDWLQSHPGVAAELAPYAAAESDRLSAGRVPARGAACTGTTPGLLLPGEDEFTREVGGVGQGPRASRVADLGGFTREAGGVPLGAWGQHSRPIPGAVPGREVGGVPLRA